MSTRGNRARIAVTDMRWRAPNGEHLWPAGYTEGCRG